MSWQHLHVLCARDNLAYIFFNSDSRDAFIVDPTDPEPIEHALRQNGLKPRAILNTHSHPDHTQGNQPLAKAYGIPVFGPAKEAEAIPSLRYPIEGGQVLNLADLAIKVHYAPGHTKGGLIFDVEDEVLVTGDTLFFLGCGNPNIGGNVEVLYDTFFRVFMKLAGHLKVLPGHDYALKNLSFLEDILPDFPGIHTLRTKIKQAHTASSIPFSTLEEERANNPFLMVFNPELAKKIAPSVGLDHPDPRVCFLRLRERRNSF